MMCETCQEYRDQRLPALRARFPWTESIEREFMGSFHQMHLDRPEHWSEWQ